MIRTLLIRLLFAGLALAVISPSADAQRRVDPGTVTGAEGGATGIGISQFIEMAQDAIYGFIASDVFSQMTENGERPRLVIGNIRNRSDNENIMMEDLVQPVSELLRSTGMVRLFSRGASDFDYILTAELGSSELRSTDRRGPIERCYLFSLRVESIYGEIMYEQGIPRCFVE